jgi:hypothetical protein
MAAGATGSLACDNSGGSTQPPPQYPPGYPQQPPPGYPQQAPPGYPQQYPPQAQVQQPRPLLPALVGQQAQQAEVRAVLAELTAALDPTSQAKIRGIPLVFDPTLEVNAYAGCDDNGAPFLAGTNGLLDAADAISQTKATDEMFGTQTYEAWVARVVPDLVSKDNASAALPQGIIPAQYGPDPRRWSRAHELFQDIMAFTFGHELSHHYLGHTGCANGQGGSGPSPQAVGRLVTRVLPGLNQFNEGAADTAGTENALFAGAIRRPRYRWSEKGGVMLLQFFGRLESAAGIKLFSPIAFLQTHPNPQIRIPIVQSVASNWYQRHRDVNPNTQ